MADLTLRTLTRAGDTTKNAPLTNAEIDANFINLDQDIGTRALITHTHDASSMVSGTIADARLPTSVSARKITSSAETATSAQLEVKTNGGALNLESKIRLGGTFGGGTSDTGDRLISSVRAGFNGGTWGTEYLDFYINSAANDARSDVNQHRVARFNQNRTVNFYNDVVIENPDSVKLVLRADTDNIDENHVPTLRFEQDGGAISAEIGTDGNSALRIAHLSVGMPIALSTTGGGGITFNGNNVWHAGNDGAGSGLDADLLDGKHLTDLLAKMPVALSGATTDFNSLTLSGLYNLYNTKSATGAPPIDFGVMFVIGSNRAGSTFAAQIAIDKATGDIYTRGQNDVTTMWSAWQKAWNSNNDGAGSGLDADLLDGQDGSFYQNASNLTTGTVPEPRLPALPISKVTGLQSALDAKADKTTSYVNINTNTTASVFSRYRLTASLDLTLPPSPADGAWVDVVNHSGTKTARVLRNGQNINNLAEDMTINVLWVPVRFVFRTGYGWFIA